MISRVVLGGSLFMLGLWAGCGFNPQPEPPALSGGSATGAGGGDVGTGGGFSVGTSATTGGAPTHVGGMGGVGEGGAGGGGTGGSGGMGGEGGMGGDGGSGGMGGEDSP